MLLIEGGPRCVDLEAAIAELESVVREVCKQKKPSQTVGELVGGATTYVVVVVVPMMLVLVEGVLAVEDGLTGTTVTVTVLIAIEEALLVLEVREIGIPPGV